MGLPIGSILGTVQRVAKVAGRVSGFMGTQEDGTPVSGRKKRLAAAVAGVLVAFGWLAPEQAGALLELVMSALAFAE